MMPPAGFQRIIIYPESYTLRSMDVIAAGATIYAPAFGQLKPDALFRLQDLVTEYGPPVSGFIIDLVSCCEPATTSAIDTVLQFKRDGDLNTWIDLVSWPRTGGTAFIVQGYRIPCLDFIRFKLTNSGVLQTKLCWWATIRNG